MTYIPGGGGGGGAVSSVFSRTGAVTAQPNDYTFAQLASKPTDLAGYGITDAANIIHTHSGADIASGTVAFARLPVGSTASTVSVGNHTHVESEVANLTTDLAARVQLGGQLGGTATSPDVRGIRESAGPTLLTIGTLVDGEYLKRSGTTLISGSPATGAPTSAQYVTLATDATLTNERVLTAGTGITLTDAGAGSTLTVAAKDLAVRTTANVALSASTTINVTALDITVASGDVWVLDYLLPATVSGGTAGLKPIFTLPASSTGTMDVSGTVASVTAYSFTHSTTPTTAAAVAFMTASFTGYLYVRAVLTMGGAGTCRIGVTTGASAAGNILAGASVLAMKL